MYSIKLYETFVEHPKALRPGVWDKTQVYKSGLIYVILKLTLNISTNTLENSRISPMYTDMTDVPKSNLVLLNCTQPKLNDIIGKSIEKEY